MTLRRVRPPSGAAGPAAEGSAIDDSIDDPVDDQAYAAAMARLGPFETRPRVAVATSGGGDSLCLAVLAQRWAAARGGSATALVVDHGLRPESAAEAAQVRDCLTGLGMPCAVLAWAGPRPRSGVQMAAREARYRLLRDWCAAHAVLHLLLAQQRDDQAETVVMRRARGSGPDGLAGMAALVEMPEVRLLRPLLHLPGVRLRATLRQHGVPWVDDPSNSDRAYDRVRVRQGLTAEDAAAAVSAAKAAAVARNEAERRAAALLARAALVHPAGFVQLDPAALADAPQDLLRRLLVRCVLAVGGGTYAPRGVRVDRAVAWLADAVAAPPRRDRARTLGGCRLLLRRLTGGRRLLVVREPAAVAPPVVVDGAAPLLWDARFRVAAGAWRKRAAGRLQATALGADGWRAVVAAAPAVRDSAVPTAARASLPALRDGDGVLAVPHLGYCRAGVPDAGLAGVFRHQPRHPLAPTPFFGGIRRNSSSVRT